MANAWTNGPDQEECQKSDRPVKPTRPANDYGYGYYGPPVLNCDELPVNFELTAKIDLQWSTGESLDQTTSVRFRPNSDQKSVPFSIDMPTDIMSKKPRDWSSLVLHFSTLLPNGTEFGLQSTEYLSIIERESMIIQSDKAKYKPGNLVNFRLLSMDVNLTPIVPVSLSYSIISPSDNKMAQKKVLPDSAVATGQFTLDKFAEQGTWTIEAVAQTDRGKFEASYSFEVEEYVLPTFEVKITTDRSFVIAGERENVPLKIDAVYTFGQPVKGDAKVTITKMPCEKPSWGYRPDIEPVPCPAFAECPERDEDGCLVPPSLTLDIKKFDGSYSTSINRKDLSKIYNFEDDNWRCQCGKNLLITASVIDKNSEEELDSQKKLAVESEKYKIDFVYTPEARREGVPFQFIAQAKYVDGSVLDVSGVAKCNIEAGWSQRDEIPKEVVTAELDPQGYFTCNIPDRFDSSFELTVSFDDQSGNDNGEISARHWASNRQPSTKELITIKSAVNDRKLIPNEALPIEIKANYAGTVTLVAVAKNEIVMSQLIDVTAGEVQIIEVEVLFDMVPEVRFVAYENRGSHWNADSLSFFVQEDFEHTISVKPSKSETKVGESVDLNIESNSPQSEVFLLGVDKSVKLLASGNDVTQQKLLEVMEKPSSSSWRPWSIWRGCGIWFPWSHGSSAESKLQDAGYALVNVKSFEVLGSYLFLKIAWCSIIDYIYDTVFPASQWRRLTDLQSLNSTYRVCLVKSN